jgi:hypothetical protein
MNTKTRGTYEPRLVSEYITDRFPNAIVYYDQPLGEIPPDAPRAPTGQYLAGIARTSRPRADAIVIDDGVLWVIEGKIIDVSLGAGKLPMYERLVSTTPELAEYRDLPRKMLLISANPAQWSAQEALTHNINLVVYQPDWSKAYLQWRNTYFTADARRARAARKARLIALGYDELPGV